MTTQLTTTKVQHPTGPYFYVRSTDGCDETWDIYACSQDRPLVSIGFWDDADGTEAIARLFTSSPDLLEALRELLAVGPYGNAERYNAAVDKALAAIAQTEGRA